jgi:hypothetical protein
MGNIAFGGRGGYQSSTGFQEVNGRLLSVSVLVVCASSRLEPTILVFRSPRTETRSKGFEMVGARALFSAAGTGVPTTAAMKGRAKMALKILIVAI